MACGQVDLFFSGACSWSQRATTIAAHWMPPPPSTRSIAQFMLFWYYVCHSFLFRLFSSIIFSSGTLGYCAPEMLDPTTAKVFFDSKNECFVRQHFRRSSTMDLPPTSGRLVFLHTYVSAVAILWISPAKMKAVWSRIARAWAM